MLSDLKDAPDNIIKSGISLAKMINGELQFFHVKKPTDIVEKESQLSAIRTINKSFIVTNDEIGRMVEPFSKTYDIKIKSNHAFGNIKNEISKQIQEYQPDIIVLGKRKSKSLKFIGDSITDFVIKNHDGTVIIASDENALEPNQELSLGILNSSDNTSNMEFANHLIEKTQKPLKLFKTDSQNNNSQIHTFEDKKTVELKFDYGANSMKSLSNYLSKSDINLLCVNRESSSEFNSKSGVNNVIGNVNVSLLISGK